MAESDVNVAWVQKVRVLENLRRIVSELLEQGHFESESAGHSSTESPAPTVDGAMEGIESGSTRSSPEHPKEESLKREGEDETILYPALRNIDEDGDASMASISA